MEPDASLNLMAVGVRVEAISWLHFNQAVAQAP